MSERGGTQDIKPDMKNNNVMGNLEVGGTKIEASTYSADSSIDNSHTVNDNSSVVNSTKNTVYNQTVIDDTKKSVTCEISGRKVLIVNSVQCPLCGRTVSTQCYNIKKLSCVQCEQDAEAKYIEIYSKIIADGGVIDEIARKILNKKAVELKIEEGEREEIEYLLRKKQKQQPSTKLSSLRQKEFDRVLDLLKKGEIEIGLALSKVEAIHKTTSDADVSYWYYLILANTQPNRYFDELRSSNIDIYWQQFWAFYAALNNNNIEDAIAYVEELKGKYINKHRDYALVEIILLLKMYEQTQEESYIVDAEGLIKLIDGVDSSQLTDILELMNRAQQADFVDMQPAVRFYQRLIFGVDLSVNSKATTQEVKECPIVKEQKVVKTPSPTPVAAKVSAPTNTSKQSTIDENRYVIDLSADESNLSSKGGILDVEEEAPSRGRVLGVEEEAPDRGEMLDVEEAAPSKFNIKRGILILVVFIGLIILVYNRVNSSKRVEVDMNPQTVETIQDVATEKPVVESSTRSTTPVKEESTSQNRTQVKSEPSTVAPTKEVSTVAPTKSTTMAAKKRASTSAADGGEAESLYAKGEAAYNSGRYSDAVALYKNAAAANSYKACLKLAEIYTSGVGNISANAMQAKKWRDKSEKLKN